MKTRHIAMKHMYLCAYPKCTRLLNHGIVCVDHRQKWDRYVIAGRIKEALRKDFQAFLKEEKLERKREREKWL